MTDVIEWELEVGGRCLATMEKTWPPLGPQSAAFSALARMAMCKGLCFPGQNERNLGPCKGRGIYTVSRFPAHLLGEAMPQEAKQTSGITAKKWGITD